MDPDKKAAMLANTADSLPLKRWGEPGDMGEAIYYLLTAKFCTGVVLDVDGGHGIRQYANPNSDPMRKN
jgi:NAD(P)-dependent dehydrogenase (short-subunit alcohol dehydrogenase family)